METVTYKNIVARYGNASAYDLLLTVEKLAKINSDNIALDEETRFQKALKVLDKINFAEQKNVKCGTN